MTPRLEIVQDAVYRILGNRGAFTVRPNRRIDRKSIASIKSARYWLGINRLGVWLSAEELATLLGMMAQYRAMLSAIDPSDGPTHALIAIIPNPSDEFIVEAMSQLTSQELLN